MKKYKLCILLVFFIICGCSSHVQDAREEGMENFYLTIDGNDYELSLYSNQAVDHLLSLLPLSIQMNDLQDNEKYYYFDNPFPIETESVNQIRTGDLMLFNNDCLVLFYDDFTTSYQYTRIGYIKDISDFKENINHESVDVIIQRKDK